MCVCVDIFFKEFNFIYFLNALAASCLVNIPELWIILVSCNSCSYFQFWVFHRAWVLLKETLVYLPVPVSFQYFIGRSNSW